MKIKCTTLSISCLFILLSFAYSCNQPPKDTFTWSVALSAPKFYVAGGPRVEFFYRGKSIAGASSGTGIQPGWGKSSGGYSTGERYKEVPDSVFVSWRCAFDLIEYEGGFKLPRDKMLELFKTPVKEDDGLVLNYSRIVTGMAPGGNITLWMGAGPANTEIGKFKADSVFSYDRYDPNSVTLWTSTGSEAKEIFNFGILHGIPYQVWEKKQPEYDWDSGFTLQDSAQADYKRGITYFTREGSEIYGDTYERSEEITLWGENYGKSNNNRQKKAQLPVHIFFQWLSPDRSDWFEAQIALPKDFDQTFLTPYTDPLTGKLQHYNRIIVGMEKKTDNQPYTFGRIWIDGPGKQLQIMRFRAAKLNVKTREFPISVYSIPKGFTFPVWQGREPLPKPQVEFWQEK